MAAMYSLFIINKSGGLIFYKVRLRDLLVFSFSMLSDDLPSIRDIEISITPI
jgi:hypothetical protein